MNFPFGFIQWHSQSQQMLSTKYRIPRNPGSSMLCEVKGREFLKSIGNKTFFNLSCPFFLGGGHCSLSFWPFKSVGSTKGGGGTADIVTSASFSITSLLSLFMSLSEIVLQSPSKSLFIERFLNILKKLNYQTSENTGIFKWNEHMETTCHYLNEFFCISIVQVVYITTNEVPIWEHIYLIVKLIFLLCISDCKDTFLCILLLLLFDKHQLPWTVLNNDLISSSNDSQRYPRIPSLKSGNPAGIGSKSWLGEVQLVGVVFPFRH